MISWRIEIEVLKVIAFAAVYSVFLQTYKYVGESWFSIHFDLFLVFFDMKVCVLASMILGNPNGAGLSRSIVQRGSFHGFGFGGEHASRDQNSAFFWFPNPLCWGL